MGQIDRFSVSLDTELLAAFDRFISARGYDNRSEAIRDMIRELLVTSRSLRGQETVSAILAVVCDHRFSEAFNRLRAHLAEHTQVVRGSLHVTVDEHRDGVAIALLGPADQVQAIADTVQALRGITNGRLSILTRGD